MEKTWGIKKFSDWHYALYSEQLGAKRYFRVLVSCAHSRGRGLGEAWVLDDNSITTADLVGGLRELVMEMKTVEHVFHLRSFFPSLSPGSIKKSLFLAVEMALLDAWAHERGMGLEKLADVESLRDLYRHYFRLENTKNMRENAVYQKAVGLGVQDFLIPMSGDFLMDEARLRIIQGASTVSSSATCAYRLSFAAKNGQIRREYLEGLMSNCLKNILSLEIQSDTVLNKQSLQELADLSARYKIPVAVDSSSVVLDDLSMSTNWMLTVSLLGSGSVVHAIDTIRLARSHGHFVIIKDDDAFSVLMQRAKLLLAAAAGMSLGGLEYRLGRVDTKAPNDFNENINVGASAYLWTTAFKNKLGWGISLAKKEDFSVLPTKPNSTTALTYPAP